MITVLSRAVLGFFRPVADAASLDPAHAARIASRWQTSVFLSITLGYTIYYVTRLPMSVARVPMISTGVVTIGEVTVLDTVFLVTYGIGKTLNGFLADRTSARRVFATALLASALANLVFGVSSMFVAFVIAWTINGWVQSVGVPVSGVVMAAWYPPRELGTRYSIWSVAHHLGEGLTLLFSANLIGAATLAGAGGEAWRAAFLGPALLGFIAALVLYRTLADRPQAVGLPAVAAEPSSKSLGALQLGVLRDPAILVCGLASGLIYVSRYAINHWGVFYMHHEHGYELGEAGAALSIFPLAGIGGTLLAGPISDRLTNGMRVPVAVAYGIAFCVALAALFHAGNHPALIVMALASSGFAMGGLLVFLGGLLAIELCSKRAAGAALGVIGGFSYLGAGMQSIGSKYAIEAGQLGATYDFTYAKLLWLGAPCLAIVLAAALWIPERRRKQKS